MKRSFLFMAILACSLPSFAPDADNSPAQEKKSCLQALCSKAATACSITAEFVRAIHVIHCDVWNLKPEDR